MKTINIFLASSNELKSDREDFVWKINRKNKILKHRKLFLNLDVWEDMSAKMSPTRSQDEYNKVIKNGDLFVLLAYNKVGMYTAEEFETAYGAFSASEKPFIFTYFKNDPPKPGSSLQVFKDKLNDLGHFWATYKDENDLWQQFNHELDLLEIKQYESFEFEQSNNGVVRNITQGNDSIYIENIKGDFNLTKK